MTPTSSRTLVVFLSFAAAGLAAGCTRAEPSTPDEAALPHWTFDPSMVFPADHSLARPEDGVALPDGRLIVADQAHGLRRIDRDGTSAPFGEMIAAGYLHRPPQHAGGPNGVSLEPGGTHLLVADIFQGWIYRVEVATGAAERVYQHRYGVNSAVRDSRGAIWFTQSAHNPAEEGEARMWAAVETGQPEGALLRLAIVNGRPAAEAEVLVDGLSFANGVALDERNGHLYLAETLGGRVLRYRADFTNGRLGERSVFAESLTPDNLVLDAGRLWVIDPLNSELLVFDTATGARHSAFRAQTSAQAERAAEILRRIDAGQPRVELFTPDLWEPLPALITGVIVSPGSGAIYLTGLGDTLVRLPR